MISFPKSDTMKLGSEPRLRACQWERLNEQCFIIDDASQFQSNIQFNRKIIVFSSQSFFEESNVLHDPVHSTSWKISWNDKTEKCMSVNPQHRKTQIIYLIISYYQSVSSWILITENKTTVSAQVINIMNHILLFHTDDTNTNSTSSKPALWKHFLITKTSLLQFNHQTFWIKLTNNFASEA